jgi:hypothetical protein
MTQHERPDCPFSVLSGGCSLPSGARTKWVALCFHPQNKTVDLTKVPGGGTQIQFQYL